MQFVIKQNVFIFVFQEEEMLEVEIDIDDFFDVDSEEDRVLKLRVSSF